MFMSMNYSGRAQDCSARPGDTRRRIAHRREQLGLTREQVAARAGLDPHYVEYLESRPDTVGMETLTGLAGALGTAETAPRAGGRRPPTVRPVGRPGSPQLSPRRP